MDITLQQLLQQLINQVREIETLRGENETLKAALKAKESEK